MAEALCFMYVLCVTKDGAKKEEERSVLFNDVLNTFIYCFMVSDIC